MNRYTPRKSAEFEARQGCFDFGMACRFVANLAASVKKDMKTWAAKFFAPVIQTVFPPVQEILDLEFKNFPLCQPNLDPIF